MAFRISARAGIPRVILSAWLVALAAPAAADFGDYHKHVLHGQTLQIASTRGELRVTALNDSAFEVHYAEFGVRQLPGLAIDGDPAPVETQLEESSEWIEFAVPGLAARIGKSPLRIDYFRNGEPLVSEEHGYFAYETLRGFRFALDPEEKILGGGQRVLGMDRRGKRLPLYNKAHYGYSTESWQMYYSLPAILSSDRYIIAFDNTASGWLDIASTEQNVLQFEATAGRTAYIIVAGSTYPQLIESFTDVVGRQPLPPRWAFGNFASRFGYHSEAETRDVVRRFRLADIPLDAVILDIYWFGPDIQGHMGRLDWDRKAFPTPEKMVRDFAADGVRTIAITEPFILTSSDRWDDAVSAGALARNATGKPKTFDFYFGNTGLVDVFDEQARDWFWKPYQSLFALGMAGSWGDLGEPEVHPGDALHWLSDAAMLATADEVHNAYGHRWTQMIYEKQVEEFPEMRPVIMMRSGFLGTQRYAMLPWTGDVERSWGGLQPQIELALQMSLFGLAYTHSDLGGFAGGEVFDSALYTRWLQYGVFQPVFRPHAQEHIPPEPVFHDAATQDLARAAIRLRYSLLPYIYTLAWENSTTGMPLMRPLFFENENDASLIDNSGAYFWGNAFLVAPVTRPGQERVDIDLPEGAWFDFASDRRYAGGAPISVPVSRDSIPVLVRAGSFIPMTEVVRSTDEYASDRLTLHFYADDSVPASSGRMYEDDGHSRNSLADGNYEMLHFDSLQSAEALTVSLSRTAGAYTGMPGLREMTIVIHNWTGGASSVTVNDRTLPIRRRLPRRGDGTTYDLHLAKLTIRLQWDHAPLSLRIRR